MGGGLEGCRLLHRLQLSHNRLTEWPSAALAAMPLLQHADLSYNAIELLCASTSDDHNFGGDGNRAVQLLLLPPSLQVCFFKLLLGTM